MTTKKLQPWSQGAWDLTRQQHGVVTRRQLLGLGMPATTIRARLASGRIHRLGRGVYAVGRPDVGRLGHLMAAVLACGPGARLSHRSAGELWRISPKAPGWVDVSVPSDSLRRRHGIRLHRRVEFGTTRVVKGIPVADPISVLIDLAADSAERSMTSSVGLGSAA